MSIYVYLQVFSRVFRNNLRWQRHSPIRIIRTNRLTRQQRQPQHHLMNSHKVALVAVIHIQMSQLMNGMYFWLLLLFFLFATALVENRVK